jgi:hypothetical protein
LPSHACEVEGLKVQNSFIAVEQAVEAADKLGDENESFLCVSGGPLQCGRQLL